jgi:hypothetical protein
MHVPRRISLGHKQRRKPISRVHVNLHTQNRYFIIHHIFLILRLINRDNEKMGFTESNFSLLAGRRGKDGLAACRRCGDVTDVELEA